MTTPMLRNYAAALARKKAELSTGLQSRDGITIERSADALDEVQLARERDLAIRNLDRESILLHDVKSALRRIADGSYGICLHCDEEIKPKRLEALPWAKYCIGCQAAADLHRFEAESGRPVSGALATAA